MCTSNLVRSPSPWRCILRRAAHDPLSSRSTRCPWSLRVDAHDDRARSLAALERNRLETEVEIAARDPAVALEHRRDSHFSFLRGASSCEELFDEAARLGIEALAVTDRNSVAGIVRAHEAAKVTGVRLIVGCRVDLTGGMSVLVYPTDRPAYARLCRLLSIGKKRGGKAQCRLDLSDVIAYGGGVIAVLLPDEGDDHLPP